MYRGLNAGTSCGEHKSGTYILYSFLPAIFLFVTAILASYPQPAQAQTYTINTVRVEGNQRIEASTIATYTGIERGQTVSLGDLNDAYQRVLDSGLFEIVEMEPRGNTLVISVQEYPTINQISFEGNRRIKDDQLGELIESSPRRVFNADLAERDAATISTAYSQQGRVAAQVTPRIIRRSENRVDLVFEIFEGTTVEIERVSVVGNREFSDRRLRRVLETKQAGILRTFIRSDTLIEDRIEFDKQVLRDFYLSRGYVDFRVNSANVELTRERDAFYLVLNVTEGQQFRFGEIRTTSEMSQANAEEFQAALKVRPGVIYSPTHIENSIARQERLAIKKGIDFLRVEPRITRNDRDLTLDVEFVLTKGPRIFVERIDIEGNTTTLDRIVRQQFRIAEGDPFNPREIRESAKRIRALGFFSDSSVTTKEGSAPDQVVVDVNVEEQPTGSISLGGSFSTNDGLGIAIGLEERNFLGRGQRVALGLSTATERREYTLGFSEPYLLGRDLRFDIDLGYSERDSSFTSFDTKRLFFMPAITFPTGENSNLELRFTALQNEMLNRSIPSISGDVIRTEIAQGALWSNSLGFNYTYDSRVTGLNPNAGWLFQIGSDFAGIGGDNEYIKSTAKLIAQTKVLNEEVTLRASFETGSLYWLGNNSSRAVDRFILGTDTIRGFEPAGIGPRDLSDRPSDGRSADDALGGNVFAVARFEAQFPLGLPEELGLTAGLFYDVSNLWGLENAFLPDAADCPPGGASTCIVGGGGAWRHVIGISFHWDTGLGPLRFNFSKALKKEWYDKEQNFDLTISTSF